MRPPEPVEELLVERATQGLDSAGQRQLEGLLSSHPQWADDSFDLAAAAIDLAISGPEPALRPELRDRLGDLGRQFVLPAAASSRPLAVEDREPTPVRRRAGGYGWWAAAAALLLALAGWWPRLNAPGPPASSATPRAALLADPSDVTVEVAWQATEMPQARGAEGTVVWSEPRQTGFLEIRGLAPNDPRVEQYQLWIFDRTRDERYPVDGGVFDIPADAAEVVVPIEAKIDVGEPYLFAVTIERPGGVVVSDRGRIVLVAEA